MVQGINNPQGVQTIRAVDLGQQGNHFIITKPYEGDSFNGKTLLKIAGFAGALYFRKNIANFFKNMCPPVAELVGGAYKSLTSPLRNFVRKYKSNYLVKSARSVRLGFLKTENKIHNWFGKVVK